MRFSRREVLVGCAAAAGCHAQSHSRVWLRKRNLPEARIFEIAAAVNGRIYCVTSGEDGKPGTEVHEYTPEAYTWIRKSRANLSRHSFGAGFLDGRIYIWGGVADGRMVRSTEMYDPASDTWTRRADFPRPRIFAKGAGVAGKLYAVGGIQPPGRNQVPLMDEYDPEVDRWTPKANMPAKRDAYRVAVARGRVYVVGNLGGSPQALEYEPASDRWTVRAPMPPSPIRFRHTRLRPPHLHVRRHGGGYVRSLRRRQRPLDHQTAHAPKQLGASGGRSEREDLRYRRRFPGRERP